MITSQEEARSVIVGSLLHVDEKIQEALYEKLGSADLNGEKFQELSEKLTQWQKLSRELVAVI